MEALIVVDMQNDFISGSLAVPNALEIIEKVQELIKNHQAKGDLIIATMDWHPQNHSSFKQNGGIWPAHCVVGTEGNQFGKPFQSVKYDHCVKKGQNAAVESYSAFYDEKNQSNGLHEYLQKHKIKKVKVCGLALDFCVKATAEDAIKCGYEVSVYQQATKAVFAEKSQQTITEMKEKNIHFID